MLTAELVQQADYIFGMTHSHVDTVMLLYPQAAEKTFLLREFDETLDPFEKDISDPIGGSYEVYVTAATKSSKASLRCCVFWNKAKLLPAAHGRQTATTVTLPSGRTTAVSS